MIVVTTALEEGEVSWRNVRKSWSGNVGGNSVGSIWKVRQTSVVLEAVVETPKLQCCFLGFNYFDI